MLNESKFKTVYQEFQNLVYNLSLSYVQNTNDAEDITQEVFIKVYHHLHQHQPELSSLKTWIYRITVNQCLDFLKSKKTKKRFGFMVSIFKPEFNELTFDLADFKHPGVLMEDKEELQQLFKAINQLPENQKTAIILCRIEELSQKEVAEMMKTSVKAVESLLQRAKQNLAKILKENEGY